MARVARHDASGATGEHAGLDSRGPDATTTTAAAIDVLVKHFAPLLAAWLIGGLAAGMLAAPLWGRLLAWASRDRAVGRQAGAACIFFGSVLLFAFGLSIVAFARWKTGLGGSALPPGLVALPLWIYSLGGWSSLAWGACRRNGTSSAVARAAGFTGASILLTVFLSNVAWFPVQLVEAAPALARLLLPAGL